MDYNNIYGRPYDESSDRRRNSEVSDRLRERGYATRGSRSTDQVSRERRNGYEVRPRDSRGSGGDRYSGDRYGGERGSADRYRSERSGAERRERSYNSSEASYRQSRETGRRTVNTRPAAPRPAMAAGDEQYLSRMEKRKIAREKRINGLCYMIRTLFMILLFLAITIFLIFGKRPTVSNEENRTLATMPKFSFGSYFSGEFTSGVSNFFNDTVPGRSKFKTMIAGIESCFGLKYGGGSGAVLIGTGVQTAEDLNGSSDKTAGATEASEAPSGDETATAQAAVTETETVTEGIDYNEDEHEEETEVDPNAEGELTNNILIVNERALMLFGGSKDAADAYAETVNEYKSQLGSAVNVYSMVIPTAGSFYMPDEYKNLTNDEKEYIDYINTKLDPSVVPIDAYGALEEHKAEKIYARTDHHWLPLGAYYAGKELAKAAGVEYAPLDSYGKNTKDDYVGTMYGYTGSDIIKNNPEEFTYYIPQNNYTTTYYNNDLTNARDGDLLLNIDNLDPVSYYLVFMGGDDRITHVHTDVANDRCLIIIKDSYGNATVPCYVNSFEDIYVIDMRYFNGINIIDFANTVGCTDLAFEADTYTAMGSNREQMEAILNQSTQCDISERLNASTDGE